MLIQFMLGLIFIALPLFLIFGLPIIQSYFNEENAFTQAIEDCEILFIEESTRVAQVDSNQK